MVYDISNTEHQFVLPFSAREGWNARPPKRQRKLCLPVTFVRYTYTGAPRCIDDDECALAVEKLQRRDFDAGHDDIQWNFLIGGGGTVYEGRGWNTEPYHPPEYEQYQGRCLTIAYIGDYSEANRFKIPPWEQRRAGFEMLRYGLRYNFIDPAYVCLPFREKSYEQYENPEQVAAEQRVSTDWSRRKRPVG